MKRITTLVIIFFVTLNVQAEGLLKVSLKDKVILKSEQLTIKDLVVPSETDLDFIRKYGDLLVLTNKDSDDSIDRSRFYSSLIKSGANIENLSLKMNGSVEIERGQDIDLNDHARKKVLRLFTTRYRLPKQDVKFLNTRILPKVATKDLETLYFKTVQIRDLSNLKNAKFKVVVEDEDGRVSEHTLFASLDIETTVLVAKQDIDSGATLEEGQFIKGRQKIKKLKGPLLHSTDLKSGNYKYTKSVKKDEVLLAEVLRESILVKEGALVTLSYKTPHLTVSTLGKVRGSAEIGQVVRVENIDSQRIVNGKLVSPDLVEVVNE